MCPPPLAYINHYIIGPKLIIAIVICVMIGVRIPREFMFCSVCVVYGQVLQ